MTHNHERRLTRLESKLLPSKMVFVWQENGETGAQAVARHFGGESAHWKK